MTDKPQAKRGRPRSAAPKGKPATPDIAAIVAAAVALALKEAGHTSIADVSEPMVTNTDEEAQALREIRDDERRHAEEIARVDELAAELIPLVMQARHQVVFDWMCQSRRATPGQVLIGILRSEIAAQGKNYREAIGGGGGSSRDLAALSERIPVHKVKD